MVVLAKMAYTAPNPIHQGETSMRYVLHFALVLSVAFLLAVPLFAEAADSSTSPSESTFVYKPPLLGAPSRRVGGATRGSGKADFVLNVLAPDQTGLTTQAQPILYWYASGPSATSVEVTVIADVAEKPLLSKDFALTPAGMLSIDLSNYGITLKPDTDYEWFVSVVPDPEQRSKDVTSGGTIRRVAADPAVMAQLASASERDVPRIYAEAGLWYDAIEALSRLIERKPGDQELRSQRAALLDQIGLPDAAKYDRAGSH